jgi:chemotaxis protein MotB
MARMHQWIGLAVLGISLTGCVSSDQYSALKLDRDRIAEQLVTAERQSSTAEGQVKVLQGQLDALSQNGNNSGALNANLTTQLANAQQQLDDLNRRYQEVLTRPQAGATVLPPKLNDELQAFANANPDLVDFDSAHGMVKFKSDVTFGVGDATVTGKAKEAIDRFAKILSSPGASGYELLVAGHTDKTPVHNQATIAAGHKDNWYLSAHRAIAVGTELVKNGVNSARLGVVGYADQRPIASNVSESGKAQNRRVEVLILPTTIRVATSPGQTASSKIIAAKGGASGARVRNLGKDSVSAPIGPIIGK